MITGYNDLEKFAISNGIGSGKLDSYRKYMERNAIVNPTIIEERSLNVAQMDVFSRLLMERQIALISDINDDVSGIVVCQLLWLAQQDNSDITLLINSPGGSVTSGLSIVDTMDIIEPSVSTQIMGMAASMGAVISSNGEKGKRYMLPHSRFMIHQPMGGLSPHTQASDYLIGAKQIELCRDELYEILSENSNLSVEEIAQKADRDCWLRAPEAIELGFVDEIIKKKK